MTVNVLSIHRSADLAGISGEIARAFAHHPEIHVRSLIRRQNYLQYPQAEPWTTGSVLDAWHAADVVHLHDHFGTAQELRRKFKLPGRPYVLHHHGSRLRGNPASVLAAQRRQRATGIVSTLDLVLLAPGELEWLPAPINVDRLARLRHPARSDTIRIAHAPTSRRVKGTDAFLATVTQLQRLGYPIEVDLIERVPWAECLRRKAEADLYYDQVELGYGSNALEAWAMGIPVIAGAADATLAEMERRFGRLPFYRATTATLADALRTMCDDPALRATYGKAGYEYVRRFHDYPPVASALTAIYRGAAA